MIDAALFARLRAHNPAPFAGVFAQGMGDFMAHDDGDFIVGEFQGLEVAVGGEAWQPGGRVESAAVDREPQ